MEVHFKHILTLSIFFLQSQSIFKYILTLSFSVTIYEKYTLSTF